MYELFLAVVDLVLSFGYVGVFIMTFIESTFVPIPAEITLIPAGFLVAQGKMNFFLVWLVSTAGTMGGSLLNYWVAYHYGRRILLRYGKYFFINEKKLRKIEHFFERHGAISTFTGRLLPGVKHFIAFPAGLARMNIKTFCFYTLSGGAIWCGLLIYLGYIIGENHELIKKNLKVVNIGLIIFVFCLITLYSFYRRRQSANK
jgi:membrane protein DedA with SNARE-associated domain